MCPEPVPIPPARYRSWTSTTRCVLPYRRPVAARGAQMATFDISHPDVADFIRAKRSDGVLRQFNCSLLITDDFIEGVKKNSDWPVTFPVAGQRIRRDRPDRLGTR